MNSVTASPIIQTNRLILRLATQDDVDQIILYYYENQAFLAPFEPKRMPDFYTAAFWRRQVEYNLREFNHDQSLRLFLFKQADPNKIIGSANFSSFIRGVFHSCFLGYSLAEKEQGQGYMTEALQGAIAYVFDDLNMHRISANYMPHNRRSGNLLKRLGFVVEGYARDYLFIDGQWQDHILTSLTNRNWHRALF
ncbi:MAG TPA: ribosomal protein S5-alanine N-acetyltransferase [Crinalium sp.]|jgi:ribosomal-protein-alanine N-acetyltransferase